MKCKYGCGQDVIYKNRCSKNWQSCPENRRKNSESCKKNNYFKITGNYVKKHCRYCNRETTASALPRHEPNCYLNPKNIRLCECGNFIKNKNSETCSYACANKKFRSRENNGNWSGKNYRIIAFDYYPHECENCGYNERIQLLEVHHIDGNHENIKTENLIILCPNCHTPITRNYAILINRKLIWL
jgi:hypothetical protein